MPTPDRTQLFEDLSQLTASALMRLYRKSRFLGVENCRYEILLLLADYALSLEALFDAEDPLHRHVFIPHLIPFDGNSPPSPG